ncbi:MAG TPA: hypothetical protein P5300_05735, partial [Acidobacteriota bacterium]|nr:hypothetical protein [Acidobacteriota bacterium]
MNAEGSSRTVYKIKCESPALGGWRFARLSPPGALSETRHVGGLRGLGRLFAALVIGLLVVVSGSCVGTPERFRYG